MIWEQGRQSWGLGVATPRFRAGGIVGRVVGGHGRVWENTISYLGLTICWKVICYDSTIWNFLTWLLKKVVENFACKIGHFLGNHKLFSDEIENFSDRIHDPQTSKQIDAAVLENNKYRSAVPACLQGHSFMTTKRKSRFWPPYTSVHMRLTSSALCWRHSLRSDSGANFVVPHPESCSHGH